MKLTALTCTCDRHEAFALCELWISRQTRQPDEWVVLDDGEIPVVCSAGQRYVRCPQFRGNGSMIRKLEMALRDGVVTGDGVVVVEDDDWYAPDWLKSCVTWLALADLAGESRALYYNVAARWYYEHANLDYASFCSTAFTRALFATVLRECKNIDDPLIDMRIWKAWHGTKFLSDPKKQGRRQTVGIKAMPGLVGYGYGHRPTDKIETPDPMLAKLRSLIGDDADRYAPFRRIMAASSEPPRRRPNKPMVFNPLTGNVRHLPPAIVR